MHLGTRHVFFGFLDFKNIDIDIKYCLQGHLQPIRGENNFFVGRFEFLAQTVGRTFWILQFLKSAYSKTPNGKFSCF